MAMAPTGQIHAHVPQEMHFSGSIRTLHGFAGSPAIAMTGHAPAHV
jgi:hypothetical protein